MRWLTRLTRLVAMALLMACVVCASAPLAGAIADEPEPDPALQGVGAAVTKGSDTAQYQRLDELRQKTLGTVLGTTYDSDVWARLDDEPMFRYFNDMSEMLIALKRGRIDAGCLDDPVARIAVERNVGLAIMPEDAGYDANAIAMPKGSRLTEQVSNIVERFLEDGTIESLEKKWCSVGVNTNMLEMPVIEHDDERETLVCAVDDATEPMSFRSSDGQLRGLEVELAYAVANELGVNLDLVPMSFDAIAAALNADDIDMAIAGISITDERSAAFDLSPAYRSALVRLVTMDSAATGGNILTRLAEMGSSLIEHGDQGGVLLEGIVTTMIIAIMSVLFGVVLGNLMDLVIEVAPRFADLEGLPPLQKVLGSPLAAVRLVFLAIERVMLELPVVVVLLLLRFVVFGFRFLPGVIIATIGLSLALAAKVSDAHRTSVANVGKEYWDTALALGYTRWGALSRVIIPAAWPECSEMIQQAIVQTVFDTSVVGLIAVCDVTRMADLVRARTTEALPALTVVILVYYALSYLLGWLFKKVRTVSRQLRERRREGTREKLA